MCGIAGVVNFDGAPISAEILLAMTNSLAHRGPDGVGTHVDRFAGLGHRRLAIIDLSEAGHEPMPNEDGTLWLTFNGEIYNFQPLRAELEKSGHRFRSNTDAEVILHAYEQWGVDCVSRFNGMFAFGLWDARNHRLWLVRDRIGVKPLFWARTPRAFMFGSEVKAVLAHPDVDRDVDLAALGSHLAFNYMPAPQTLFRRIHQVEPGHYLLVEASGAIKDVEYWDVRYDESGEDRSEASYKEELSALLSDAVRLRLVSDVPFGVFLSGGVDSSGVAYWMSRHMNEPVKTFSIGFGEETYSELKYARAVAQRVGADHHERVLSADAATVLPTIVRHAEEPTADSSMVAVYHLAKLARGNVTMVLSGDGADDILAGYETYQAYYIQQLYRTLPQALRQRVIAPLVRALPVSHAKVSWDTKLKRFVAAADLPWEDAHASWRIIFDREARAELLTPVAGQVGADDDPLNAYRRSFAATNARHPLNRMLYVDTRLYLPAAMLVKIDRMTMAHGLEGREPYLDYRLVEFAARVPPRLKLKWFTKKKYLLKEALEGKVPADVLHRKKQGFNVPKGRWIQNGLKSFVTDHLAPSRIREMGLLNSTAVDTVLRQHFEGEADNSHQIWSLLVLVLWFEQFVSARHAAPVNA
jgi:asparagine synthase (glutamine-hydrolysing)